MRNSGGFSIVELLVVIMIMGILATLAVVVPTYFQKSSRDSERADDVASIARRLEQAYNAQENNNSPTYPSTTQLQTDITNHTGTMLRLSPEAFNSPGATSSSVTYASAGTSPGAGSPSISQYLYQPLNSSNALCTNTDACVRFFLYYRTESGNTVQIIKSIHQQ